MGTATGGPDAGYCPVRIANTRTRTYHSGLHRREPSAANDSRSTKSRNSPAGLQIFLELAFRELRSLHS